MMMAAVRTWLSVLLHLTDRLALYVTVTSDYDFIKLLIRQAEGEA